MDLPTTETHESLGLEASSGRVDAGSLHAEHGAEIGLGQAQGSAVGPAMQPDQPFGQPLLNEMGGVADRFGGQTAQATR
ncbi:hypothetical protein DA69_04170 [Brevundimonas naejangsanensis]|uniref:Uncharacterized protein n=1 Tax=Brevundimonas naejangsanensis TaxID=588932 RepID=A0A172Y4C9_9CAUL|nr:hypothetical protein DA69_04170 [Brevundimonas naejangsanensis]